MIKMHKYKNTGVLIMQCSILYAEHFDSVPEENLNTFSTKVVPNIGYLVKNVLTASNSIGCTSHLNFDNVVLK